MRKSFWLVLILIVCLPLAALADATSSTFRVLAPAVGIPGGYATSTNFTLYGSMAEVAHGATTSVAAASSTSFRVNLGFFSFPFTTTPVLTATAGDTKVDLSWSASVPYLGYSISGYEVGKATAPSGPYTFTAVGNVLIYSSTSLTNGTPYYFVVRALDQTSISVSTSTEKTATPVAPTLTFIVDSSQNFPSLTPGTLVATSSILDVKTTNATGFTVTLSRQSAAATLALGSDTSVKISDKTDWTAPAATTSAGAATASSTQPQTLQFRLWKAFTDGPNYASSWWGSADTDVAALFAGIPSTTQSIAKRSISAPATTTMRVLYNLNASATQKNGAYSGAIIYSVSANP